MITNRNDGTEVKITITEINQNSNAVRAQIKDQIISIPRF